MSSPQIGLKHPFRQAIPEDASQILPLARSTAPGFAECVWAMSAKDGESPGDIGLRNHLAYISNGQSIVAELDGKVEAILISYGEDGHVDLNAFKPDDVRRPLVKLTAFCTGNWFIHQIACTRAVSGKGIASEMMLTVERLCRLSDRSAINLCVLDSNRHAIEFYRKRGYAVIESEAAVTTNWSTSATAWLLMEKVLD